MPLSLPAVPRQPLHRRTISIRGYKREDGLFDVEGHLHDTKDFDFNVQQFSITNERKANVDFSSPYYETTQTVITIAGSKADSAKSISDLRGLLVGAQTGTTSFDAIEKQIKPNSGWPVATPPRWPGAFLNRAWMPS